MTRFLKVTYLPVIAMVLGGGLALASQTKGFQKNTLADYDVAFETDTYYQVGTPPSCNTGTDQACNISSPQAPDLDGRIPKSTAGVLVNQTRSDS